MDFLDAELEDEIKVDIRRSMIDGDTGNQTLTTLVKSQDERYIDRAVRTYIWSHVSGTDYSLALVLPEYSLHYLRAAIGDTITQAKSWTPSVDKVSETLQVEKFSEYGFTFIAQREYCTDLKPSNNNTEFLINLNKYIDSNTPNHPLCDSALVNKLLLDAGITSELVRRWSEQTLRDGVSARFVATDGGITRVYPSSAGLDWSESTYKASETLDVDEAYKAPNMYETYESSLYKRSLDNDLYIFTPPVYNCRYNSTVESVVVSRAVDLNIDGVKLKPAVIGVRLDVEAWMERFINATVKTSPSDDGNDTYGCSRNDENVDCVLLDDGGFLIMANRDEYIRKIGKFFGMVDPLLMNELINISVFSNKTIYDYQSTCKPEEKTKSAAGLRSVYVPTIADMLHLGWWASATAWSIMQQLLVSFTFPSILGADSCFDDCKVKKALDVNDEFSDGLSKESCITEQTLYFFESNETSFSGIVDYNACTRKFYAEKLSGTNLLFVITEAQQLCEDHCKQEPPIKFKGKQPSPGPNLCELAQYPRYRRGPKECFQDNSSEQDEDCGRVAGLSPSLWVLVLLQVALLGLWNASGYCVS